MSFIEFLRRISKKLIYSIQSVFSYLTFGFCYYLQQLAEYNAMEN